MKKMLLLTMLLSVMAFSYGQNIEEDFNSGFPSGWTTIDGGSNNDTWYYDDGGYGLNGTNGLSISTYPGPASDHLVTPQYQVSEGDVLAFYVNCSNSSYPDNLHVLVSKTGTAAADFTDTLEFIPELSTDWTRYEYQLTAADFISAGDQIYVALYTDSEGDYINLDNFILGQAAELIYEEFTDTIPDGWTIIDEGNPDTTWSHIDEKGYDFSPCVALDTYNSDLPNDGAADDWLITPQFEAREGDYLSFWIFGGYASGGIYDTVFVKISKTGVNKEDFTVNVDTLALLSDDDLEKYSWLITDIPEVAPGDLIYVGLHARSNGSNIYLDNFRVGKYIPPQFTAAYAVSETAMDVIYDIGVTDQDIVLNNISLTGSDGQVTFSDFEVDPNNNKLVHFTGASPAMTGDNIVDTLVNAGDEDSLSLYSGILPLTWLSLTNPDGTLINDGPSGTFQGIVTYINGSGARVWLNDAPGAHHGINVYQSSGMIAEQVSVGDEVLIYGSMSAYQHQTEIYPASFATTLSTGNDLFDPTVVTGADIDTSLQADADPAEQYEGVLLKIDSARVLEYSSSYFLDNGDSTSMAVCSDGEGKFFVADYSRFEVYNGTWEQPPMETGKDYTITGILVNRSGKYILLPRYEADMSEIEQVVGLEEISSPEIEMYPNPVTDHLNIQSEESFDRIILYNAIGQRVKVIHPEGRRDLTINTADLRNGLYFVTFQKDGKMMKTTKIIKRNR